MNLSKRRWTQIGLLMGAVAAPLLSITGCGGGGGNGVTVPPPVVLGTPTPIPPTPTPDPNATPAPTGLPIPTPFPPGTSFTPNYLSDLPTGLRWSSFPINVYFVPDAENTIARRAIAITGFNQWVTSTGNRVPYRLVNNASQSDIAVSFYAFTGGAGDQLGVSEIEYNPVANLFINVNMRIGFTRDNREDIQTSAHEYGHSVGIFGHSSNPADLMFPTGNTAGCSCITQSDVNTLFTIYNGQFNIGTGRTLPAPTGPTRTVTISRSRNGCSHAHHD